MWPSEVSQTVPREKVTLVLAASACALASASVPKLSPSEVFQVVTFSSHASLTRTFSSQASLTLTFSVHASLTRTFSSQASLTLTSFH